MRASICLAPLQSRIVNLFGKSAADFSRSRRVIVRRVVTAIVVKAISVFGRPGEVSLNAMQIVTLLRSQDSRGSAGGIVTHSMGWLLVSRVNCLIRNSDLNYRRLETVKVFVARATNKASGLSGRNSEECFLELRAASLDQNSA